MTPEIETEISSLKLRLVREEDAEELFLRNDQNRGHLRQWMPWLDETKSASDTLNFIRRSLVAATAGTQYHYALLLGAGGNTLCLPASPVLIRVGCESRGGEPVYL